ncbi:hypothetical protein PHMEG_00019044 [Phytophthora megakarya]|uniref:Reverse transcriptase/retrotransposon-derived protein RNase H-like domain-containing protein n=1 Tax=Phytophthora megakarya TaxID=4795 RepID=A0A225VTU7_9STRA|nr:hypothetical protein PHMEG_00019044 [Phytophthora megakarya]
MSKCSLFSLEVLWCGRLISGAGIRHDPNRVRALSTVSLPATVADLQYFWNALNVATTWSAAEQAAYESMLALVRDSVLMAIPDPDAELLVFTDASLTGYSIIGTQGANWEPNVPVAQEHQGSHFRNETVKHLCARMKIQQEFPFNERRRLQDMAAHKGTPANFNVGDFVLLARFDQRRPTNKLLGQWVGPFKVIEAKQHSFLFKHLITGRECDVHVSRLRFCCDEDLNQSAELLELVSRQGIMLGVDAIRDHCYNRVLSRWELLVSCVGLQAIENSWEPLVTLLQDVSTKVNVYVASTDPYDELRYQVD